MNFFNRAIRNVTRKPAKSVLLAITFFVIGNLVIIGLGISSSSENAKTLTRKQMRAIVNYEGDYESFYNYVDTMEDMDEREEAYKNPPNVTVEDANKFMQDERVVAMSYLKQGIGYSSGFEHVPVGNDRENNMGGTSCFVDDEGNEQCQEYSEPNITIVGSMSDKMIETYEETYKVTQGRFYNQDEIDSGAYVCVITEELAAQNGLSVGDTISFTNNDKNTVKRMEEAGFETDGIIGEFEIVGIYNNKNEVNPNSPNFSYMSPFENPKNYILMPLSTYAEWQCYSSNLANKYYAEAYGWDDYSTEEVDMYYMVSKVSLLLNDPLNVEQFVEDHKGNLKEYMKLSTDNDTFEKLARPLDTLSFFANIIVWIVTINAIIIISLVTALTLKTRESEIGVLLSIGVSKAVVILQLFTELAMVAFFGFILATATGIGAAGWVGDKVLEFQQSSEIGNIDDNNSGGSYYYGSDDYFTEITQADILSQYHVEISPIIIVEIYVIGLFVVFISIMIPSVMIMRLNPKQILLSTN
ncbi:MAG: ABC transporter permease [Erysipelotrichaceae bacterium]|nr:ABC transporter permease [Erysipelotrichaceae bacterium]